MTSLYVGNLPYSITETVLAEAFTTSGFSPKSVRLITDRETGQQRGFGFVDIEDGMAEAAIATMTGVRIGGRELRVSVAAARASAPRPARPPEPGGGGGGGDRRPPEGDERRGKRQERRGRDG